MKEKSSKCILPYNPLKFSKAKKYKAYILKKLYDMLQATTIIYGLRIVETNLKNQMKERMSVYFSSTKDKNGSKQYSGTNANSF